MHASQRRVVFGAATFTARIFGWILIVLAILSIPQLRSLMGRSETGLALISSVALGLGGALWLVSVESFLRFFDKYLSRN
jgi:hypothetical protein